MTKKLLSILIIITLFFAFAINSYASSTISIEAESKTVDSDKFSVKIIGNDFSEENSLVGIKLDLFYDNEVFEVTDAKKSKAAGSAINLYENYANEGRVRIGMVSITGLSNSGELYEVFFKVINKEKLGESSEFKVAVKETTDKNGNTVSYTTKPGIITFDNVQMSEGEEDSSTVVININDNNNSLENIEASEDLDVNLNETSILKNNINTIIHNKKTDLDLNTKLTYTVENEDIISIDDDGNIIAKSVGETNIIVRDENGNEEIIPISIVDGDIKNNNNNKSNSIEKSINKVKEEIKSNKNVAYIVAGCTLILLIIILIIVKSRKKKRK